jgi:hypothetical protein
MTREDKIDISIRLLKNLERTLKLHTDPVKRKNIRERIRNVRAQLAELCMTDQELNDLINK